MNCPVCTQEVNQEVEPTWISYNGLALLHLACADQLVATVIEFADSGTEFIAGIAQAVFRNTRVAMGIDA